MFEKLSGVLFDQGPAFYDFKIVQGGNRAPSREQSAQALFESMTRAGLIDDGKITPILQPTS